MRICPKNNFLLIEVVGPGDYTTKSGILIKPTGEDKMSFEEVCRFRILAIPDDVPDNFPYEVGMLVCAQGLNCRVIRKRTPEDISEKQRYYIRHTDILSTMEGEESDG